MYIKSPCRSCILIPVRRKLTAAWSEGLVLGLLIIAATVPFDLVGTERITTEVDHTEPRMVDRTSGITAEQIATERLEDSRYEQVVAAIGPPPSIDAVPVLGYETKAGVKYPPRWRTRPDTSKDNNFGSN